MELPVFSKNDIDNENILTGESFVRLDDNIFNVDFNESLVHQVVTAYLAAARSGNQKQKTRSEVRGGGKKPWRQKGTGRARAGTIRSPLWRGGGVVFAAKPRDYSQKVNKKMYRLAIKSIISEIIRQNRLVVVNNDFLVINSNKTKDFLNKFSDFSTEKNLLIIMNSIDINLYLSCRNLHNVFLCDMNEINPVDLVKYNKIVITEEALKRFEDTLK